MGELSLLRGVLRGGFSVSERPQPVPGDLRVEWGISLVLLILASARGLRCSLQKLHFLAHLSRTERLRRQTMEVFARKREPGSLSIRIEPWVNRAVAFAAAEDLVEVRGKAIALTQRGQDAVGVLREASVLRDERAFLDVVGPKATEKIVDKIMKMEQF